MMYPPPSARCHRPVDSRMLAWALPRTRAARGIGRHMGAYRQKAQLAAPAPPKANGSQTTTAIRRAAKRYGCHLTLTDADGLALFSLFRGWLILQTPFHSIMHLWLYLPIQSAVPALALATDKIAGMNAR